MVQANLWTMPQPLIDAIRDVFGPGDRTFKAIGKRAAHAYRVWGEKYGPWTPTQAQYALDVVVAAVVRSEGDRARCYASLSDAVNHEVVDAGFKKRAAKKVDISRELAELAA